MLGPGQDGRTIQPEGVRASALTPAQQTQLLDPHQLFFRNSHHPNRSVYLANALVPTSQQVAVTAQRRDSEQTELTIDYVLRGGPSRVAAVWLLAGLAAAAVLSALLIRKTG